MSRTLILHSMGLVGALLLAGAAPALADPLSITSTVGGTPSSGTLIDLSGLGSSGGTVDGINFAFTGTAGLVTGSETDVYAAPYISGAEATWLDQTAGPDILPYLTAGSTSADPGSAVTLTFQSEQTLFGLLWGSVDTYNTISVYNGDTLLGEITGSEVSADADGDQGADGTDYVEISSTTAFDKLVFTSSNYAFEFTGLTYDAPVQNNEAVPMPEPGSLMLFGAGLAFLGVARLATRRGGRGGTRLLPT